MKPFYIFFLSHLKEIITGLKGSNSFVRNVAYNLSGNTFVLIIGFLLTPVIAKIYGPEAYGNFAIFTAIASLIIPFATLQLQAGYVAAESKIEFFTLVRITLLALVTVTILSGITLFVYVHFIDNSFESFYFAIPIYVFFSGLFIMFRGWNIKLQEFKRSAQSRIAATVVGKSSTLSYGIIWSQDALGIVIGSVLAFISESIGLLSKRMLLEAKLIFTKKIEYALYRITLLKYKQYPTYVALNSIINSISTQLPIYFIATQFTKDDVGLFSLSLSLIQIPLNLMGTSIGAVFLPKIAAIINDVEIRNKTVLGLFNKLFYVGVIGLLALALVLGLFLTLLLGDEWAGASHLSSFMAISFAFAVAAIPLSVVFRLIHYEKANLKLTLFFIVFKICGLVIGGLLNDFNFAVFIYFFITLIQNASQIILLFKKLNISIWPIIRNLAVVILLYLSSYFIINF